MEIIYRKQKDERRRSSVSGVSKFVISLLLLTCFLGTTKVQAATPYYGTLPTNITKSEALASYNAFKSKYLESCGNSIRVKWDDLNKTVSEGIGYGMLMAVYADDRESFDGLYKYYKSFLNEHGFMHWQTVGCSGISGYNGATDADLDVAMALVLAHSKWGSALAINYNSEGKSLIGKIKQYEVESGTYVLKPGDMFGGSDVTNISYFATSYFREFGKFTNDIAYWNAVAEKCYAIIFNNLSKNNAKGGLVSDWCKADGTQANGRTLNYGYDACRTPWRVAFDYYWNGDANAKTYLDKVNYFINNDIGGIKNVKDGYSQNGTVTGGYHNVTYVGTFACAGITSTQTIVNEYCAELKSLKSYSYFDYCFEVFGKFFLAGMVTKPDDTPTEKVTINASAGTGGSIDPSGSFQVDKGSGVSFNITPLAGYKIENIKDNGISVPISNPYKINNATENHTIVVSFSATPTYTITASAGTGGIISPSGAVIVSAGADQLFTISLTSGKKILDVKVDGISVGAVNTYKFTNVTANHIITATFEASDCNLLSRFSVPAASALPSINNNYKYVHVLGSIAPVTNISTFSINWDLANKGLYQFSINTNNGIPNWYVDLRASLTYTFDASSPTAKISNTSTALDGDYYITIDAGNLVLVDKSGNYALCFSNSATPPQGCDIVTYTINATAGTGGSITPNGAVSVAKGSNKTFSIMPSNGYSIGDVTVDGLSVGVIESYTFTNVTANHSITASFKAAPSYTITATAGTGGTITPSGSVSVASGSNQTFAIAASAGYKISDVTVNGISVGAVATYAFANVTANQTIEASFAIDNNPCDLLVKYAVPRQSSLPTLGNKSYTKAYVLGTGGPNMGNVTNFTINWDLSNNGLYQFSFNTNNGVPSWWIDLLPKITHNFGSRPPSCKLSSTGITGLDGDYWANVDGENFVLIAKSGAYALYFSNGAAPTGCPVKSGKIEEGINNTGSAVTIFPNPLTPNSILRINLNTESANGAKAIITDISGKVIQTFVLRSIYNNVSVNLKPGLYFINISAHSLNSTQKLIVK